jgi:hypothetical protein
LRRALAGLPRRVSADIFGGLYDPGRRSTSWFYAWRVSKGSPRQGSSLPDRSMPPRTHLASRRYSRETLRSKDPHKVAFGPRICRAVLVLLFPLLAERLRKSFAFSTCVVPDESSAVAFRNLVSYFSGPSLLEIYGPAPLHGARLQSFGDHRIAMAFAVAGLFAEGETIIQDAECIRESYPGFETVLEEFTNPKRMQVSTPVIGSLAPVPAQE